MEIGQCFLLVLNPWKINEFVLELLPGVYTSWGSLEYQFVVAPSREIMSDLARVASSLPDEAMATL
jgi:hypothetical protein